MITPEDIKNLAALARIEISGAEMENLTHEVDSILEYIGQIQSATGDIEKKIPEHRNVMRADVVTTPAGQYTEKLLANAPTREGNYVKVKKIL